MAQCLSGPFYCTWLLILTSPLWSLLSSPSFLLHFSHIDLLGRNMSPRTWQLLWFECLFPPRLIWKFNYHSNRIKRRDLGEVGLVPLKGGFWSGSFCLCSSSPLPEHCPPTSPPPHLQIQGIILGSKRMGLHQNGTFP